MINHEFPINIIQDNDLIRLNKLHEYEILDTSPEDDFDTIASIAGALFETDNAFINFIDESRIFFKAKLNHQTDCRTSRKGSLHERCILDKEIKVFYELEPLTENTQFYAAAPILTADGFAIGTIGVTDSKPHEKVTNMQLTVLQMLSRLVMEKLEKRLDGLTKIRAYEERLHILAHDIKNPITSISLYAQLLGTREMTTEKVFSMAAKVEFNAQRIKEKLNRLTT